MIRSRRHSWPFNAIHNSNKRKVEETESEFLGSQQQSFPMTSSPTMTGNIPAIVVNDEEDALLSAGILPSNRRTKHKSRYQLRPHRHRRRRSVDDRDDSTTVISSIAEAEAVPSAILRRIFWQGRNKACNLFYHESCSLSSPDLPSQGTTDASHRPVKRHRRCHSEQPRAWREPSAGLWTLEEE
ncbi:hypothetical protein VTN31DRAFT_7169 [Thermomyces dupontii]|uniref:uncharacterized protein n=1 Tax=Talaromyces thermophilus TaxID=28565 RepID=UPI003742C81C